MEKPQFNFSIVLVHPEIPGNTGSIGRTCVALQARLILIEPCAFDLSEKAVRRAGLDYWKYVELTRYQSFDDFLNSEKPPMNELFLFSKLAKQTYFKADFTGHPYLVFGSESKGLPTELMQKYCEHFLSLPMFSDNIRSLNLSNAATAVAYEVIRQKQYSS